jgi:hypothetical protein
MANTIIKIPRRNIKFHARRENASVSPLNISQFGEAMILNVCNVSIVTRSI